ncbi:hypothetical protein SAMN04488156_12833 [Bacillus sp. 166amftsu]|nr:hypothetical protein SAMN04488156_12833 [Bacillus sp. 166amftsu]
MADFAKDKDAKARGPAVKQIAAKESAEKNLVVKHSDNK